ncbi:hypothetical protein MAR_021697 [Mya arenaria]|uniref:Uncharacterized protein n=1 Tax=Mya arenaria TaxID=6604 RepID=A0ABY7E8M4_MYAAR|nr:hypothetical protein MAR_021697 [Mya arenaria]
MKTDQDGTIKNIHSIQKHKKLNLEEDKENTQRKEDIYQAAKMENNEFWHLMNRHRKPATKQNICLRRTARVICVSTGMPRSPSDKILSTQLCLKFHQDAIAQTNLKSQDFVYSLTNLLVSRNKHIFSPDGNQASSMNSSDI